MSQRPGGIIDQAQEVFYQTRRLLLQNMIQQEAVTQHKRYMISYTRGLYRNQKEIFEAVSKGEIEAGLMWAPVAGWLAKSDPDSGTRIISASRPELIFSLAIGVRAEDQDLKLEIDNAIDETNRSGKGKETRSAMRWRRCALRCTGGNRLQSSHAAPRRSA